MRFREPFLTAGLNEKQAVNRPQGTYRGFRLDTNAGVNTVTVVSDPSHGDHVAVYETVTGFSLAIRKTGGDFNISLAGLVHPLVEKTWLLCIFADYAIGATTAAEIRAYELDPTDEFTIAAENPELVVLGRVVIPAASAAPLTDITSAYRRMAWMNRTSEAETWQPLIRNGGFEVSYDDASGSFYRSSAHWRRLASNSTTGIWETNDADPRTGRVALGWNAVSTGLTSGTTSQHLGCPVTPGQLFKYQFYKKALKVPTGGGMSFALRWANAVGDDVGVSTVSIDTSGVDGDYVEQEGVIEAIAGAFFLHQVEIVAGSISYGSTGTAFLIDDVQVWAEGFALDTGPQNEVRDSGLSDLAGSGVVLYPTNFNFMATSTNALVELANGGNNRGQDNKGSLRILDARGIAQAIEHPLTGSTETYTLISEAWTYSAAQSGVREYVTTSGELHRTVNAKYSNNTTNWTKDDNGTRAMRVVYSNTGMRLDHQEESVNTWADGAWTRSVFEINGSSSADDEVVSQAMPPTLRITDDAGNAKFVIDHGGFPVREHMSLYENWNRQDGSYTWSVGAGMGVQNDEDVLIIGVDMTSPLLEIVNGGIAVERNTVAAKGPALSANMHMTWEFWLGMEVVGANDINVRMGVNRLTDLWSNFGLAFEKEATDTNWHARAETPGDGLTRVDLGVAPAVKTGQKFRMELYKGTAPGGARALFFIDGILLHSMDIESIIPSWAIGSTDEQQFAIGLQGTGVASNSIYIGPIHQVWHVIEGDYGIRDS
jgi:hypothetical protein